MGFRLHRRRRSCSLEVFQAPGRLRSAWRQARRANGRTQARPHPEDHRARRGPPALAGEARPLALPDDDVDAMFADFCAAAAGNASRTVPSIASRARSRRSPGCARRGIKIGFDHRLIPARRPRSTCATPTVRAARPTRRSLASEMRPGAPDPFMRRQNAINLQVDCVAACVKVDDTIPGVEEGPNAGMWSIGPRGQRQRGRACRSPTPAGAAGWTSRVGQARARLPAHWLQSGAH